MAPELGHVRAALRLALQSWRTRSGGAPPREATPRRRLAVERRAIPVEPARVAAYLRATRGDGVAALRPERGAPAPPVYSALWETALALELLAEGEIGFPAGGMIHLGSELVQLRPLRVGDAARCRLELDGEEREERGTRLELVGRNWSAAGQLCSESRMLLLLRGREGDGARRPREERGEAGEERSWEEVERWELRAGEGRRYARVSGDFNPIHLWGWSSRIFGFRRPILHGYCSQAMVAHALVRLRLGGDPGALRRLRIHFRAPLPLPARPRLLLADHPGGGAFRLLGDGARRPFAEGEWVGTDDKGEVGV